MMVDVMLVFIHGAADHIDFNATVSRACQTKEWPKLALPGKQRGVTLVAAVRRCVELAPSIYAAAINTPHEPATSANLLRPW
jgi:hypothetical protein